MLYLRATSLFYFGSAVERSYSAVGNGGGIAWEAIRRLIDPSPVPGTTII
jgi:Co/Zn/Cd efflux system component